MSDAPSDRALVSKVHVVDGASLRFTETGSMQTDSWEIEWEATPAPAERARFEPKPQPAQPQADARAPAPAPPPKPEPTSQPTPTPRTAPAAAAPPPSALRPAPAPQPWEPPPEPAPPPGPSAYVPPPPRRRPPVQGGMETMPTVFRGLHPDSLHRAIDHFDVIDLYRDETLIGAGERHPALVMVLRGQLEARRGDERRRAGSGEVLGFTTLFGSGRWPTTLRTLSECRLMILELGGYQSLRSEGSRVALAIEEFALEALLDGLVRSWGDVANFLTPQPLSDVVPRKSFFERCAAAFGAGGILSANVNRTEALVASPLFRNADSDHLKGLATRFGGLKVDTGEFLLRQGESSTSMFLVVDGAVDVLSDTGRGDKVVCHESLGPGALFGESSMLRTAPSPASYVARERTVLLELDRVAWADLALARNPVGNVLRLAVLRSLTRQLVDTNARIVQLRSGGELRAADLHDRFVTILPGGRR